MKIVYKKYDELVFKKYWQKYYETNEISYKYALDFLEFYFTYNEVLKDFSFVVYENEECLGICFLPLNQKGFILAPLSKNDKVEKIIFDEIEQICLKEKVSKLSFYEDTFNLLQEKKLFNTFKLYGYIEQNTMDFFINLKQDESSLWSNLRKRFKSNINSILKDENFEFSVLNHTNLDYDFFEKYRLMHHKIAGVNTKPKVFFDKQFELMSKNLTTLFGLKYKNEILGFAMFFHDKKYVSYAIGVNEKNLKYAITHALLYKAMLYFKALGYEYMSLGQPCSFCEVAGFGDYADEKQINISNFKKGMSSSLICAYRGVRYFDEKSFNEDLELFKYNFKQSLNKGKQ